MEMPEDPNRVRNHDTKVIGIDQKVELSEVGKENERTSVSTNKLVDSHVLPRKCLPKKR